MQEGRGGAKMAELRGKVLEANSFRERLYENPVGNVWVTGDGAPPAPFCSHTGTQAPLTDSLPAGQLTSSSTDQNWITAKAASLSDYLLWPSPHDSAGHSANCCIYQVLVLHSVSARCGSRFVTLVTCHCRAWRDLICLAAATSGGQISGRVDQFRPSGSSFPHWASFRPGGGGGCCWH